MLGLSYAIRLSPRIEKRLATLFTPSPSRVGHPGDPYNFPRAHASQTLSRAATPPPPCAAPLPAPLARRQVTQGQIDRPQTLLTSPRSSLAYKYPPTSTVARLLLLPP